jgi:hypothetical protein
LLNPPTNVVLPDGMVGPRVPETILWYVKGEEFLRSVSEGRRYWIELR